MGGAGLGMIRAMLAEWREARARCAIAETALGHALQLRTTPAFRAHLERSRAEAASRLERAEDALLRWLDAGGA